MQAMDHRFAIGKYTYHADRDRNYFIAPTLQHRALRKNKIVGSYDRVLHQHLEKIFREKIKDFLRGLRPNNNIKSMVKPILEQESALSRHFLKEELENISPLWISVLAGYEKSAELLVRSGTDVNEIFGSHMPQLIDEKWTILHVLIQMDSSKENERFIRLVIEHGADLQARDRKGRTVLHYAVDKGRIPMIKMLLEKGADVNTADEEGMTPLLVAISNDNIKAIELASLLMKHGADVLARGKSGENALHRLVALNPQEQVVSLARVLIEKGVSVNDRANAIQFQPIHQAASSGNNELVKLFLDHGANVNARALNGEVPLYYAVTSCRNNEMLETLIQRGANVNQTWNNHKTALHYACLYGSVKKMGPLLAAGANMFIEDHDRKTPFDLVKDKNISNTIIKLMIRTLARRKVCLQPSFESKGETIIKKKPVLWTYYQNCLEEFPNTKSARFIESCTLYELLTKCQCQIAPLMRKPEFETEFRRYDLQVFLYAEDILEAFDRAQRYCHAILQQEELLSEAVYYILPDLVVHKVVDYLFDCCKNVK